MGHGHGHGGDGHDGFDHSSGHFDGHGALAPHMCHFAFDGGHAGMETTEAIVIGHAFCDLMDNGQVHVHVDNGVHDNGQHFGHGVGTGDGTTFHQDEDLEKQSFGIVVVGHGHIDLHAAIATSLARQGLIEHFALQGVKRRMNDLYQTLQPIREATQSREALMPSGYYPNATGLTSEWRSYYQLGTPTVLQKLMGKKATVRDPKVRTYVEVESSSWFFAETGDYETRILVKVVSPVIYESRVGEYGYRKEELETHLAAARNFANDMLSTLRSAKPSQAALDLRASFR